MTAEREVAQLVTVGRSSARNFRVGQPVQLVMTPTGGVRLATRWERLAGWLRGRWLSVTRWRRPRTVCSEIDVARGAITMAQERWSWRRWRWERETTEPLPGFPPHDPNWWRRKP